MNRIMKTDPAADENAKYLGFAFQYINFIRDINEDIILGRQYIPQEILDKNNLDKLDQKTTAHNPEAFQKVLNEIVNTYTKWQEIGLEGISKIPRRRARIAIKTASDMYLWTSQQIRQNPSIIFERKVKPIKRQIILSLAKNSLMLPFGR